MEGSVAQMSDVLDAIDLDQIQDIDSHEMVPAHLMGKFFGSIGEEVGAFLAKGSTLSPDNPNGLVRPSVQDDTDITPESVWTMKGAAAPGAIDLSRRTEVLDVMGVDRQLVFPSFGLLGFIIANSQMLGDNFPRPRQQYGREILDAWNEFVMRGVDVDTSRVRLVAILQTDTLEAMMADAHRLIEGGVGALWLPVAVPPGGVSPASHDLDPLWSLAQENDVPLVLHIGTELELFDPRWRDGEQFVEHSSIEAPSLDIYTMSTFHFGAENFLAATLLGGVFERYPRLRFGVIECTASWVGPLARRLDMMSTVIKPVPALPMRPSEYLARNVRVTPFWFEPVDEYYRNYPDLADVYAYSSDYPHTEGGKHTKQKFYEKLAPLGEEVVEKFFRRNGQLLLPGRAAA
jgi:predicted TIM-barrel fold metal-dependent hydrolase